MTGRRPRIAFIVQRYGEECGGGAESYCRQVAERLTGDCDVEVLTTCATDHLSWQNVLLPGEARLNGVLIKRFPTAEDRNLEKFHKIYDRIFLAQLTEDQEREMIRHQGPFTPALVHYVRSNVGNFDAFIVFSFLYYTAIETLPLVGSKAIFVPTAHDEPILYAHILDRLFHLPAHIFFNTEEERFLVQRRFNLPSSVGQIVGIGMDEPAPGQESSDWEPLRRELDGRTVLTYIGRVENGKGCEELAEYFLQYAYQEGRQDLTLLALGKKSLDLPDDPQIVAPGFVSEYAKFQALRMSAAGIAPSPLESMCMAALETWMHEKPMLVNGNTPVLVGHCMRSNGGLWYSNYAEFREALNLLLGDPSLRETLGRQGREYVLQNYQWTKVLQAYRDAIARIMSP